MPAIRDLVGKNTHDIEMMKVELEAIKLETKIMRSELSIIRRDSKEKVERDNSRFSQSKSQNWKSGFDHNRFLSTIAEFSVFSRWTTRQLRSTLDNGFAFKEETRARMP